MEHVSDFKGTRSHSELERTFMAAPIFSVTGCLPVSDMVERVHKNKGFGGDYEEQGEEVANRRGR